MTITKLFVKAILEQATSYKWTLQGLGMLRLYLSDEVRLHVWDSRYRISGVSALYTHPWHFRSTVIAGVVQQFRYNIVPTSFPTTCDVKQYESASIRCGAGAVPIALERVLLLRGQLESYNEGQTYSESKHEIHESYPGDGTVTIVQRFFSGDRDGAKVFWESGQQFVSAEPRPATTEEVLDITRSSLNYWFQ